MVPQTSNLKQRQHERTTDTKARITSNSCQTIKLSNYSCLKPWLNELREYFLVHALIGSGYTTYDLLFYAVGGIIGHGGLKGIAKYKKAP